MNFNPDIFCPDCRDWMKAVSATKSTPREKAEAVWNHVERAGKLCIYCSVKLGCLLHPATASNLQEARTLTKEQ